MSEPIAWAPKANLTGEERRALDGCTRAVECLVMRSTYLKTGNPADAFRMLEKACGYIVTAREALCWNEDTMFGVAKSLSRITPRHAATLAMTLMAWELRMWPGQISEEQRAKSGENPLHSSSPSSPYALRS